MDLFTRRRMMRLSAFALAGASTTSLAACNSRLGNLRGNASGNSSAARINGRVDQTLQNMFYEYPKTRGLAGQAAGILVMPLITEAGLGVGAGYGRGALRIGGATVDYYSAAKANWGIQVGANQYAHVLFFMTDQVLRDFREGEGWAAGADAEIAILSDGENLSADTASVDNDVIGIVFGQAGLRLGATIEGTKYTRMFQ